MRDRFSAGNKYLLWTAIGGVVLISFGIRTAFFITRYSTNLVTGNTTSSFPDLGIGIALVVAGALLTGGAWLAAEMLDRRPPASTTLVSSSVVTNVPAGGLFDSAASTVVVCPHCGAKNRVSSPGEAVCCGRCQTVFDLVDASAGVATNLSGATAATKASVGVVQPALAPTVLVCPHCGAKNRVSSPRETVSCGRCQKAFSV